MADKKPLSWPDVHPKPIREFVMKYLGKPIVPENFEECFKDFSKLTPREQTMFLFWALSQTGSVR